MNPIFYCVYNAASEKRLGSSLDPGEKKCFEAAGDSKEF
jgi:hypothetical protein